MTDPSTLAREELRDALLDFGKRCVNEDYEDFTRADVAGMYATLLKAAGPALMKLGGDDIAACTVPQLDSATILHLLAICPHDAALAWNDPSYSEKSEGRGDTHQEQCEDAHSAGVAETCWSTISLVLETKLGPDGLRRLAGTPNSRGLYPWNFAARSDARALMRLLLKVEAYPWPELAGPCPVVDLARSGRWALACEIWSTIQQRHLNRCANEGHFQPLPQLPPETLGVFLDRFTDAEENESEEWNPSVTENRAKFIDSMLSDGTIDLFRALVDAFPILSAAFLSVPFHTAWSPLEPLHSAAIEATTSGRVISAQAAFVRASVERLSELFLGIEHGELVVQKLQEAAVGCNARRRSLSNHFSTLLEPSISVHALIGIVDSYLT